MENPSHIDLVASLSAEQWLEPGKLVGHLLIGGEIVGAGVEFQIEVKMSQDDL